MINTTYNTTPDRATDFLQAWPAMSDVGPPAVPPSPACATHRIVTTRSNGAVAAGGREDPDEEEYQHQQEY
jgi:hypothetical protein